uniref:Uncharacterized protein n=1 Tax=Vespula pensylvanica TaxID=30213 RepID=A0A834PBK9_VESPE|nr:hypothetical protein H0235_003336 [Vespula pensylvanica]
MRETGSNSLRELGGGSTRSSEKRARVLRVNEQQTRLQHPTATAMLRSRPPPLQLSDRLCTLKSDTTINAHSQIFYSATNWHGINETGSSYMKRDETTQDKARRRSSFKVSMKDPCSCPVVQRPYHLKAEPYTHLNTTDHGEFFAKNQFAQLGGSSLIW